MTDLAITPTDDPIGPTEYRYILTRAWWSSAFDAADRRWSYLAENVLRLWVPADRSREWQLTRELSGRRTWLLGSAQDAANAGVDVLDPWPTGEWRAPWGDFYAADERRNPQPPGDSWQRPSVGFFDNAPRDPATLLARLKTDARPDRPGYCGAWVCAVDALRTGLVPADLRLALYRALLLLPGASVAEHDDGLSVAYEDAVRRSEVFIDPVNGEFAGERNTLVADSPDGLRAGMVTKFTTVATAVVGELGHRPPLPDQSG